MTSLNDRRDGFEKEMAHKEEVAFKIKMRRTRLAAEAVAAQCGLNADASSQYAKDIVAWFVDNMSESALADRFIADAAAHGVTLGPDDVAAIKLAAHAEAESQIRR